MTHPDAGNKSSLRPSSGADPRPPLRIAGGKTEQLTVSYLSVWLVHHLCHWMAIRQKFWEGQNQSCINVETAEPKQYSSSGKSGVHYREDVVKNYLFWSPFFFLDCLTVLSVHIFTRTLQAIQPKSESSSQLWSPMGCTRLGKWSILSKGRKGLRVTHKHGLMSFVYAHTWGMEWRAE